MKVTKLKHIGDFLKCSDIFFLLINDLIDIYINKKDYYVIV